MDNKLIVIANDSYTRALMLQGFLEANGIESHLRNVNLVQPNISDNVKVLISEADAERAIALITSYSQDIKVDHHPRKILVPVDFSPHSKSAARFALKLAKAYNSEIKLLHVFTSPIVDMVPFSDMASIQIDIDISHGIMQEKARDELIGFFEELKAYAAKNGMDDLRMGYSLREGYVSQGIAEMCRYYKPGMLIMGTKKEGFRSSELVGSVVANVVKETRTPVLVIPEDTMLTDLSEVQNVLYATRFEQSDMLSIRKLLTILSEFQLNITCANVCENPDSTLVKANMTVLKEYITKVSKKANVTCELIRGESTAQGFADYMREKEVNLLALTMHNRTLLDRLFNPSLTRKMLSEAHIPLLIFPE